MKLILLSLVLSAFFSESILFSKDYENIPLATGFDYPVQGHSCSNYYISRGFISGKHPGEDWNGKGGGNSDLGDKVFAIADGVVVLSKNHTTGKWGNTVIIRHAYKKRETGKIALVDSFYTHLHKRKVKFGQKVKRGQYIGTIGKGPSYAKFNAHLHFEIRKDLRIGMKRHKYSVTRKCYHIPSNFIEQHRYCDNKSNRITIPLNTFQTDYVYDDNFKPNGLSKFKNIFSKSKDLASMLNLGFLNNLILNKKSTFEVEIDPSSRKTFFSKD